MPRVHCCWCACVLVQALALGCGSDGAECGPGTVLVGEQCVPVDAGGVDASQRIDARALPDAPPRPDARPTPDARPPVDAPPPPDARPPVKRVFVTSLRYPADLLSAGGGGDGVEAADNLCQIAADAAGIGGTWRAWISATFVDAIDHVQGNGPWYGMDGALLFANRATLRTTPMSGIEYDELMGRPDPFYESWTGTAFGGRLKPLNGLQSRTCLDWTSIVDSTSIQGHLGLLRDSGTRWTDYASGYCSPFHRHLYCFEQ